STSFPRERRLSQRISSSENNSLYSRNVGQNRGERSPRHASGLLLLRDSSLGAMRSSSSNWRPSSNGTGRHFGRSGHGDPENVVDLGCQETCENSFARWLARIRRGARDELRMSSRSSSASRFRREPYPSI